jgi:integrase/recombinase XerD
MNETVSWTDRVNAYLSYRRSVGFSPLPESLYLPQFARFAEQQHASRLTVQLAMDWACTAKRPTPITRAYRILRLRGFAKYCQKFDPDTEIPPLGLFGRTRRRLVPHIYTQQELAELLEATSELHPRDGLRPLTYRTIYGLLASCGLRIGEAIRLTRTDVDLAGGVLSITGTKRHKSRFVPLHASAVRALAAYAQERDRRALWPQSNHFFLLDNGKPPRRPRLCCTLHRLADDLGWKPRGDYPHHRLQDFRHTFIVSNILRAFEAGLEMDRVVLALSTYVGHNHVTDTYWYVTGVPELMAMAGERFRTYSQAVMP